jgi:molecular chaperone DnaK (HSP70)
MDRNLAEYVKSVFTEKHGKTLSEASYRRLLRFCERAKSILNYFESHQVI